jgi:hypothetical protein
MYGQRMPTVPERNAGTARLAEHSNARLYPAGGPQLGRREKDLVAYLSPHMFLDSQV